MCVAVCLIQRVIFVYIPLQPKVIFDQPSIFDVITYFYYWPVGAVRPVQPWMYWKIKKGKYQK